MFDYSEIIGFFVLVGFSALYSGSEAVLMSIGPDRSRQLIQEGGPKGRILTFMAHKSSEVLITILIGNNLVNIWAASLATTMFAKIFHSAAVGITVGVTTAIILLFGEITPKIFFRNNAEKLVYPIVRYLQLNYFILYPLVQLVFWFVRTFLGENVHMHARLITKDDIEYMITKAEKEKTIDSKQVELLSSILEFPTIKAKEIMIPRAKVKYINTDWTYDDIIRLVQDDIHSRYPVCEGDLDKVIGFLHVKDMAFVKEEERSQFSVRKYLKSPFFIYEHMKIQAVFDHMNRKKVHLAIVKDENGLVVGIITLEDIVEQIFGDIQDEHDVEELRQSDTQEANWQAGIIVEGGISLRDLYNDYDIKIPLNDNYSTLAGFLLEMLGSTFPKTGQMIVWDGWSFELRKVENYAIAQVRIKDIEGEKHLFSRKEANEVFQETLLEKDQK
jgi:putative hemolysin